MVFRAIRSLDAREHHAYVRSTSRVCIVTTPAAAPPRTVTGPQKWCSPPEAFGQLKLRDEKVEVRVWLPPRGNDHVEMAKFRSAVMQSAICLFVREAKNAEKFGPDGNERLTQEQLARLDPRPDTQKRWNARLCGRANLTTFDMATLMVILPGSMPSERDIKVFLDVAEKRIEPPTGWAWPDS